MSEVKVNNGNIEDALKRFKRQCARNGVLQEVRKREHYEKPSVKRKKKSEAARKRKTAIRKVTAGCDRPVIIEKQNRRSLKK